MPQSAPPSGPQGAIVRSDGSIYAWNNGWAATFVMSVCHGQQGEEVHQRPTLHHYNTFDAQYPLLAVSLRTTSRFRSSVTHRESAGLLFYRRY